MTTKHRDDISEGDLLRLVLSRLESFPKTAVLDHRGRLRGAAQPEAIFWRANRGTARRGKRRIRFGVNGQADITGCVRGQRWEIELKAKGGRLSKAQHAFADLMRAAGAFYFVARTLDAVLDPLTDALGAWEMKQEIAGSNFVEAMNDLREELIANGIEINADSILTAERRIK